MDKIIRLKYSLASLKNINQDKVELMSEWINQMISPFDDYELNVLFNSDLTQTTWMINSNSATLTENYTEFMQFAEFKPIETELLKKVQSAFKGMFDVWMCIGEEKQNTGWEIYDGIFPLEKVWGIIPESNSREELKKLLSNFQIDAFTKYGRCIAAETHSYIIFELPGDTVIDHLEIYYKICSGLNTDPLPKPLLDLISESNPEFVEMSCYLNSNGIIKLGLIIPTPNDQFVQLINLTLNAGEIELRAALQGSLGSDNIQTIEIYRDYQGINSEISIIL